MLTRIVDAPMSVEPADQRAVEEAGDRADLRALAGRDAERRAPMSGRLKTTMLRAPAACRIADLPHQVAGGGADVRLQLRRRDRAGRERAELEEDVVGAAPHGVERIAVERTAWRAVA